MRAEIPRSNDAWLADLRDAEARPEALSDLREYLLRAVYVYLDRHREDLSHLDRRELEHLAEDFAQEALLQIQDKLDTFRGESKFTTWAYRFVINVAAAELRLHRWRTLSIEALVLDQQTTQPELDPEIMTARTQVIELLCEIIDEELTERQRFALLNVHFHNVPVSEVAQQLDTTPNNVYKIIYDARKKLEKGLEQRYYSKADILALFSE